MLQRLSSLCTVSTGMVLSRLKKMEVIHGDVIRHLTNKAIEHNRFNLEHLEVIEADYNRIDHSYFTRVGDILIKLNRPYDIVMVEEEHEGLLVTSNYAILRVTSNVSCSSYIYHLLTSDVIKTTLLKRSEGSANVVLKISQIRELELPVPDYPKQRQIGKLLQLQKRKVELCREKEELEMQVQQYFVNEAFKGNL